MKLYVMRHGPAEDSAPSGRDDDRALTVAGRERVRQVARALIAEGEVPRVILTSPLVRAVQTAEIVHTECQLAAPIETRRELAMGARVLELVREVSAARRKRVMLIGHQPDLSGLIGELVGLQINVEKAMVVSVRIKSEEAPRVRFVLDPKALQFLRRPGSSRTPA
ncbi:phosphohistidine phosphatase SixA [Pendulispora albinea]|uniref:Phosphohistidine phosphatase SixA n=1 Tax=Pendulispora albinea TaxID=2741071 RepID=A0ABZ2LUY4_9BACT